MECKKGSFRYKGLKNSWKSLLICHITKGGERDHWVLIGLKKNNKKKQEQGGMKLYSVNSLCGGVFVIL